MKKKGIKSNKKKVGSHVRVKSSVFFVLIVLLFIFTLFQVVSLFLLSMKVEQPIVKYSEKGDVDYKVYLNQNDFYDDEYLNKDMVYVSGLINTVSPTFMYKFSADRESNLHYIYDVVGEIVIYDSSKDKVFFKKQYKLSDSVSRNLKNTKTFNVDKTLNIDYKYYNSLADKFKKNYGVSSKSDFIVTFKLKYNNDDEQMKISDIKELSLTIPLAENEVNITTDNSKIDSSFNSVLGKKHLVISSPRKFLAFTLMCVVSITLFMYIIMTLFNIRLQRNKYDVFVKKILREYDRLIVNTSSPPEFSSSKIIEVDSFQELVDACDKLSVPIMYYVVKEHSEGVFYLNHSDEVFVLRVKL